MSDQALDSDQTQGGQDPADQSQDVQSQAEQTAAAAPAPPPAKSGKSGGKTGAPQPVKATVARGRSLMVGDTHYRAGDEVSVPAEEYPGLIAAGFLSDPNANVSAPSGPRTLIERV